MKMEWISQGLTEWRKSGDDLRAVTESADGIFDQLWEDIKEIVIAATSEDINLRTNGSPQNRVVIMANSSFGKPLPEDRKLTITRSEERRVGKECRSRW